MNEDEGKLIPCKCGHPKWIHYDPDTDIEMPGPCQQELPRVGHHCTSCGYDPDDYCRCQHYQQDNLAYVEQIAKEKGLA